MATISPIEALSTGNARVRRTPEQAAQAEVLAEIRVERWLQRVAMLLSLGMPRVIRLDADTTDELVIVDGGDQHLSRGASRSPFSAGIYLRMA